MSFDTIEANWRTYLMFPLYQTFGPRHKSENNGGEPGESPSITAIAEVSDFDISK